MATTRAQVDRFNADVQAIRDTNDADVEEHEQFKTETVQQIETLKEAQQKELSLANNKLSAMRAGIDDIISSYREKAELLKQEHESVIAGLASDINYETDRIACVQKEIKKVSLSMCLHCLNTNFDLANDSENAKLQRQLSEMEDQLRGISARIASLRREKDALNQSHEAVCLVNNSRSCFKMMDTLLKNHANLESEAESFTHESKLEFSKLESDFERTKQDFQQEQAKAKETTERKIDEVRGDINRLQEEIDAKKVYSLSIISLIFVEKIRC